MDELTVVLTRNEIVALRQLIHFAVQARGMEVAEASVVITKKLSAVLEQQPQQGNGQAIRPEA